MIMGLLVTAVIAFISGWLAACIVSAYWNWGSRANFIFHWLDEREKRKFYEWQERRKETREQFNGEGL